ncbi:deoxynucleotide monophosphate kinase [Pseudomonas sp. D(2018)]|uniref:deoxynucleotide monophosphate kinase family protein n=1 Tax=Pseudomonas sp. D(2018) TaxID=2502238 RepID=UPI0010FA18BE|nr:deoxynucleotide monophosphate kinase [Pseudomonas sp. D(2018)]
MNQLIIGLHGRARSGKDTVARYLAVHLSLLSYAFAEPLKQVLAELFHLTQAHLEGDLKELALPGIGKSPRELMQLLGTEWGRDRVHPQLWLLLAEQNLQLLAEHHQDMKGVVIRDVRFENEADWLRSKGGIIVHLQRPDAQQVAGHSSENGLAIAPDDLVIHNDGSLSELYDKLDALITRLHHRAIQQAA